MEDGLIESKQSEISIDTKKISEGMLMFEKRKAELSELAKKASDIKITSLEDKPLIKRASEVRKELKATRVGIEKEAKAMRDTLTVVNKGISAKEKELVDIISPAESALETQEAWVKAEQTKIDQEADRKEQALIQDRIDRLAVYGYAIDLTLLKGLSDETFETKVEEARIEWQKEQDDLAEKTIQAEKDRLELIALREKQQEAKDMLTQARVSLLKSMGMGAALAGNDQVFAAGNVRVWLRDIEEKDQQDWEVIIAGAREGVEAANAKAEQVEKMKKLFAERFPRLKEWSTNGWTVYRRGGIFGTHEDITSKSDDDFEEMIKENNAYLKERDTKMELQRQRELEDARLEGIGKGRRQLLNAVECKYLGNDQLLGALVEDGWNDLYQGAKETFDREQKKLADEKETLRQQELGEKQKYEEYIANVKAVQMPEFKSGQYRAKFNPIKSFIQGLK